MGGAEQRLWQSPDYASGMGQSDATHAHSDGEVEVQEAARRAGGWLGWFSVAAVLSGLLLGLPAHHRLIVALLMLAAGAANLLLLSIPGRWWAAPRRGESLLATWSAGLLLLVSAVIALAGARSDLDLLMFLVVPFLATVHAGTRRVVWLVIAIGGFTAVTAASAAFTAGEVAFRAVLLTGAAMLALALADLNRRAAATRMELDARAQLERLLLAESHHRVKNSLQTVADLLLLSRPEGEVDSRAFDETADRIRAIAIVHRLLGEQRGAGVSAAELLKLVAHGLAAEVKIDAVDERLDPTRAQHIGMAANELLANAVQHGRPPIEVALERGDGLSLTVRDHGDGPCGNEPGLGLQLVERIVSQGLAGSFTLRHLPGSGTEAQILFGITDRCAS
jgi:two-component sensor histidine kinase